MKKEIRVLTLLDNVEVYIVLNVKETDIKEFLTNNYSKSFIENWENSITDTDTQHLLFWLEKNNRAFSIVNLEYAS